MSRTRANGCQFPTRLLQMLSDCCGVFAAIANSCIKLGRVAPEEELGMEAVARREFRLRLPLTIHHAL